MAQKVVTLLQDDLDGSEATQTINFALDGTDYVIDLNDENADRLREALAEYIARGRRAAQTNRQGRRPTTTGPDTKEIRRWAQQHGYKVNARGRIQADVMQAYQQAKP